MSILKSKIRLLLLVKVFSYLLPLTSYLFFVSCSEDGYQSRLRELLIDDMTFDFKASSQEVTFRHEDLSNYDCQSSEEWCKVAFDVVSSKMKVSVTANDTYDPRVSTITLADRKDASAKRTFTVTQNRNTGLFIDKTDFEVPIEGGSVTVSLKSNVDYVVQIPADCDWLKLAPEPKTRGLDSTAFTLLASGNTTYHDRTALVTVTNKTEGLSGTVTVYQPFTTVFAVDSTAFEMPMDPGTFTINVASNIHYDIIIPDDCDWITSAVKSHNSPLTADTTAIAFNVKENKGYKDRTAVITLSNEEAGVAVTVNVSQPFTPVFKPDQKSFDVPMEGGTVTVNMESNVNYDVIIPDGCDWITLPDASRSKTRGTKTTPIVLKVKENPGYKDRDATVIIRNKEAGVEVSIAIHQSFVITFKADKTAFDVDMAGGTVTVNMESNIPFDVTIPAGCDWITQPTATKSRTRGTNTSAVVLRVKANPGYQDREAVVTIGNKEAGVSVGIYIHQPFTTEFKVDKSEFEVPMKGGTVTVNVESNVSFDVKIPSGCDWITRLNSARTRAGKSAVVMFSVAENKTGRDRSAVVTIGNTTAGVSTGVTIKQPFTTSFKVDAAPLEIDELGGTLGVSVAANVDVQVTSLADWLTIGKKVSGGEGFWTQQINVGRFTAKKEKRTGNVKFINSATNETVVVAVTQSRTLFIAESGIDLTDAEKSKALTLTNTNGLAVVWTSSNTEVATVNSTGTVTAVATGKCVITAKSSDGRYSDTCTVTVDLPKPPETDKDEETGDDDKKETTDDDK